MQYNPNFPWATPGISLLTITLSINNWLADWEHILSRSCTVFSPQAVPQICIDSPVWLSPLTLLVLIMFLWKHIFDPWLMFKRFYSVLYPFREITINTAKKKVWCALHSLINFVSLKEVICWVKLKCVTQHHVWAKFWFNACRYNSTLQLYIYYFARMFKCH